MRLVALRVSTLSRVASFVLAIGIVDVGAFVNVNSPSLSAVTGSGVVRAELGGSVFGRLAKERSTSSRPEKTTDASVVRRNVLVDPKLTQESTTLDVDADVDVDGDDAPTEYMSVQPGMKVWVRVRAGSAAASRKAWKKRRRSGSPILVPCNVVGPVGNPSDTLRWNLWFLLQKYGRWASLEQGSAGVASGVVLTEKSVSSLWKREFCSQLIDHAKKFGYDGVVPLLSSLYPDTGADFASSEHNHEPQRAVSVLATTDSPNGRLLCAPSLSVGGGRAMAAKAALLQVRGNRHTGYLRVRGDRNEETDVLLGAAVRVRDTSRLVEDELVEAYMYAYDPTGDGGLPLLVVTLDPPRRSSWTPFPATMTTNASQHREDIRKASQSLSGNLRMLEDLKVGDGPYPGRIVKVSTHSNAAFVDIGVGRRVGKHRGGGVESVLGMLRLEDLDLEGTDVDVDVDVPIASAVVEGQEVAAVYVRSVSRQSGRFRVSTHAPTAREKERKRARVVDKRLSRLQNDRRAEEVLNRADLTKDYDGTVVATSKTAADDRFYVKVDDPSIATSQPVVGVAHPHPDLRRCVEDGENEKTIVEGSRVRVRFEGIDPTRGQLSMTIVAIPYDDQGQSTS